MILGKRTLDSIERATQIMHYLGASCEFWVLDESDFGENMVHFSGSLWNYDPESGLLYVVLGEQSSEESLTVRVVHSDSLVKLEQADLDAAGAPVSTTKHWLVKYLKTVHYEVTHEEDSYPGIELILSKVVLGPYSKHFRYSRTHKRDRKGKQPRSQLQQGRKVNQKQTSPKLCAMDEKQCTSPSSLQLNEIGSRLQLYVQLSVNPGTLSEQPVSEQESLPLSLPRTYWDQRFRLFSQFDKGIKLDYESFFSVTPERIAEHIAERCKNAQVVLDLFCGCGGNLIQFAKHCELVIGVDIDRRKLQYASHNAAIYQVQESIELMQENVADLLQSQASQKELLMLVDVIFMSPPWGGPEYKQQEVFDLEASFVTTGNKKPISLYDAITAALGICDNVVCFLPRNVNPLQLAKLALCMRTTCRMEFETHIVSKRVKTCAVYFGELFRVT